MGRNPSRDLCRWHAGTGRPVSFPGSGVREEPSRSHNGQQGALLPHSLLNLLLNLRSLLEIRQGEERSAVAAWGPQMFPS